jgi:hypothetical protein
MKKDVAFSLPQGYTLRINQPHYHMTNTLIAAADFTAIDRHYGFKTEIKAGEKLPNPKMIRIIENEFFWIDQAGNRDTETLPIELLAK